MILWDKNKIDEALARLFTEKLRRNKLLIKELDKWHQCTFYRYIENNKGILLTLWRWIGVRDDGQIPWK
jgi:hypothetical protein